MGVIPLRVRFNNLYEPVENMMSMVAEMRHLGWGGGLESGGGCCVVWGDELIGECFDMLHNICLQVNVVDKWP